MFKNMSRLKKHHRLFFSLIVLSGVVCLWRGIWGLLDMYLLPLDPTLSYSISVFIGMAVIILTHYTIDSIV